MRLFCLALITLSLAADAFCQVSVSARLTKAVYLEGEPVEVTVKITNVGSDAVAYERGSGEVALEVQGQDKRRAPPNIWGCSLGEGSGGGIGSGGDHPPLLQPAASVEFKHLLRDYQLHSGRYTLRAFGQVGIQWNPYGNDRAAPKVHEADAVPGTKFDQTLALKIRAGSSSALRRAYEPYLATLRVGSPDRIYEAQDAISEMAPAFLEKTILGFANHEDGVEFAIRGLSRIDTAEARNDMVGLFNGTPVWRDRVSIVHSLAQMNSRDQLKFFEGLLPGRQSAAEETIRQYAILAIGRFAGSAGVDILREFLRAHGAESSEHTRAVIAIALASGGSRKAIPVLIDMYGDASGEVQNDVCGSLLSLTHMGWCGSGDVPKLQSEWRRWWKKNWSSAKMYGTNDCPSLNAPSLPAE